MRPRRDWWLSDRDSRKQLEHERRRPTQASVRTQPPSRPFADTGSLVCRTVIRSALPLGSGVSGVITRSSPALVKAARVWGVQHDLISFNAVVEEALKRLTKGGRS